MENLLRWLVYSCHWDCFVSLLLCFYHIILSLLEEVCPDLDVLFSPLSAASIRTAASPPDNNDPVCLCAKWMDCLLSNRCHFYCPWWYFFDFSNPYWAKLCHFSHFEFHFNMLFCLTSCCLTSCAHVMWTLRTVLKGNVCPQETEHEDDFIDITLQTGGKM